jgi:sodium/bile acid cotransporter 7
MGVLVCGHWLQKTFPVVVAVVSKLGGAIGETGLLVLPCITYHLTQIMLDSMLVNFWLNYSKTNKFSTS